MIEMSPTMERAKADLKPTPEAEAAYRQANEVPRGRPRANRPRARRSRIVKKRPVVMAAGQWFAQWVNVGQPYLLTRTKRVLTWAVYNAYQVYVMARTLLGGRVDEHQFVARMIVCRGCQSLQKRLVRKSPFVKLYCGSCGCPQWRLSELHRKNRFLKWECPGDKHERIDDPPEWLVMILEEQAWAADPPDDAEAVHGHSPPGQPDFGQPKRGCGG